MDFSAIVPEIRTSTNMFSSITLANERRYIPKKKVELLNNFVTEFPRICEEDITFPQFAFSYFNNDPIAFSLNQDKIAILSNELSDTKPLGNFEQGVLNKTYSKSLKLKPSRPNRF